MKPLRVPVLLFALPAIAIAVLGSTAFTGGLLWTRDGIGAGELWRLWTGHWVHFSGSHLGWNLGVMVLAGAELESRRPESLWRYTVIAAPLISLALWWVGPSAMVTFGGLSGLATGVVVLLGLTLRRESGRDRWVGLSLLIFVALKVSHDLLQPVALFSQFSTSGVRPAALSHLAGAGLALLLPTPAQKQTAPSHQPSSPSGVSGKSVDARQDQ